MNPITRTETPWMADRACRVADPDLFFPDEINWRYAAPHAIAICRKCPVRLECLAYALEIEGSTVNPDLRHGIWGGTTPKQRVKFAQQQRKVSA